MTDYLFLADLIMAAVGGVVIPAAVRMVLTCYPVEEDCLEDDLED